ncbi:2606_t:CDS:1, partial [Dentiscutata heterogama]
RSAIAHFQALEKPLIQFEIVDTSGTSATLISLSRERFSNSWCISVADILFLGLAVLV